MTGNKKGVSAVVVGVLVVVIVVVVASVVYLVIRISTTAPVEQKKIGLYIPFVPHLHEVKVNVTSAPQNCPYNGSKVSILNGTTFESIPLAEIKVYRNGEVIATGGESGELTSPTGECWSKGDTLTIKVLGRLSPGDIVRISGKGFAVSECKLLDVSVVEEPLGLSARYVNYQTVTVTVCYAPLGAFINGSSIMIINATTGSPVSCSGTIYSAAGAHVATITAGQPVSGATTNYWQAGMVIKLTVVQGDPLTAVSIGDKVQISGTGFSTSTCIIVY
ncbi:MAG: hypothetical protein QW531_03860 [Thermoplasmata archaeon]